MPLAGEVAHREDWGPDRDGSASTQLAGVVERSSFVASTITGSAPYSHAAVRYRSRRRGVKSASSPDTRRTVSTFATRTCPRPSATASCARPRASRRSASIATRRRRVADDDRVADRGHAAPDPRRRGATTRVRELVAELGADVGPAGCSATTRAGRKPRSSCVVKAASQPFVNQPRAARVPSDNGRLLHRWENLTAARAEGPSDARTGDAEPERCATCDFHDVLSFARP